MWCMTEMGLKTAIEITDPRSAPTSFMDGALLPLIKIPRRIAASHNDYCNDDRRIYFDRYGCF